MDAKLSQTDTIVETSYGKLRGLRQEGVFAFRGIPYGAPTGGAQRFLPPRKPQGWSGIRDAFEFGPASPQLRMPSGPIAQAFVAGLRRKADVESEDCLVLNVWTPSISDGGRRPVLFWIHGGGLMEGSGSAPLREGYALAAACDVVVVTVNHRLNAFGYLHLDDVTKGEITGGSHNGNLDLVAALEWVRDNIAQFGGDPNRVMIFGQSGGGRKVALLLAMPRAKGLFQRAVIQSGAGYRASTPEAGNEYVSLVLNELDLKPGADLASKLRALPFEQLVAAADHALRKFGPSPSNRRGFGLQPVVGDAILPEHPFHPAAAPTSADVPVMIGNTTAEATLFQSDDAALKTLDAAGLNARVQAQIDTGADELIALYRETYPELSMGELAVQIGSDVYGRGPATRIAERHAAAGKAPTYYYHFAWETPVSGLKAPHCIDLPFIFRGTQRAENMVGPISPDILDLEDKVSRAWVSFAATGNPNHAGLTHWPAYNATERPTMVFKSTPETVNDPGKPLREALDKLWC
jgi:para-nitrobenzyl esterase